jgi:hypothetical protein
MGKEDRFRIPITMDVPPEVSSRITQRVAEDTTYVVMREKAIKKTYNNPKITNLRKVGEYLLNNWMNGEIKIREIAKALGIGEDSIKLLISDLNFWREYPLRMIPVRGKPGTIQNSLKDINTTEKYLKQKSRTIASMEQVYDNVDSQMRVKKESEPAKKKQVIEEKQKETAEEDGEDEEADD